MADTIDKQTTLSFLKGGGEMGKLTRSKDWSTSLVGNPHQWPQSLRTALSILLNSKFPMFLFWGPALICFYNDAYRPSLGIDGKHPSILGMRGEDAWPEIWPIIKPLIDQVMSGGEATWHEDQLIPIYRNGKIEDVYWTFSYSPVNDESGRVSGVFVTCTETTRQVNSLKRIAESEKNFRNLINMAPVPAALYRGKDFRIELANVELLKLWGKDETVIGKKLLEAIPEMASQPFIQLLEDVYTSGKTWEGKEQPAWMEKNGSIEIGYFDLIYKALYDENGNTDAILAMGYDVTERVKNKQQLVESEKKFRNTVMQAPVGITIFRGMDFIVEMANESYLQIVDKTEKEFVGRSLFDSLPEVRDSIEPLLRNVMITGIPYHGTEFEVRFNRYGKIDSAYFNFVYQPLREDNGEISGIIAIANEVTPQVKNKFAIEQSAEKFTNIVRQSPIAMTILRGKDHIIEMGNNEMAKNIWHRELNEVIGKRIVDAFPELKDQKYPELLDKVFTTKIPHREKESLAWVEGDDGMKAFYLDFEYSPLLDKEGNASGIMITVYDVTEKVGTRKRILDAEERLRIAVEASELGTFEINFQTGEISYSERYLEILGFAPGHQPTYEEIVAKVHPDDRVKRNKANQRANETGVLDYELRLVPDSNSVTWIRAKGKVTYDDSNRPLKLSGGILDITNEKLSRQLIEESETQLRQLADSMPQLVWMAEPNGDISYYNHRLSEYKVEVTNDKWPWKPLLHTDDIEATETTWNQALLQKTTYSNEHRLQMADGSMRWHLSRAYPQFDEEGNVVKWFGTSTDIDDIKKHEQQKDDFIKMASHELKTPVTTIKGYVQLLIKLHENDGSALLKTYLGTIDKQISKLTKLITDLLDVTKIETGTLQLSKTVFPINELVNNIAQDIQHTSPVHRIEVREKSKQQVFADQDKISQVLINYLTNAIKYSPGADKVIIHVDATDTEVIIGVQDFGIGIMPKEHKKIFERFYRVQGKEAQTFPGFGIGLFIVQEIISRHLGSTWVESEKDKGSTFYFSLPIHSASR